MRIGEICTRAVVTCMRGASVRDLARLMRERHVGDVVVIEEHEGVVTPVGIVTDRDLVIKVLAIDADYASLRAEDLMSSTVEKVYESELVYDAIWHMRGKDIRRLPVVDAHNHLLGMLTADDVIRFLAQALGDMARVATHQVEHEEIALRPKTANQEP